MDQRRSEERTPEPLRVPPPLNELPWDIAQDQFGFKVQISLGIWA
jgi:hypothetical protein